MIHIKTWAKNRQVAIGLIALLFSLASANCSAVEAQPTNSTVSVVVTLAAKTSARSDRLNHVVRVAKQTTSWRRALSEIQGTYDVTAVESWPLDALGERLVRFDLPNEGERDDLVAALGENGWVTSASTDRETHYIGASNEPTDDTQAELATGNTSPAIDTVPLHRWATGKGVRIALIGARVDEGHPALAEKIEHYVDFTSDTGRRGKPDVRATAVASVIAGNQAQQPDIGIASEARLLLFEACHEPDSGPLLCSSSAIARSIDAALMKGANIILLDTPNQSDRLLDRLLQEAVARGVIVITTVEGRAKEAPKYLLGVRAASKSRTQSDSLIHAPSGPFVVALPGGGYGWATGSAIASAAVTGVVALIVQRKPHLHTAVVAQLLRTTARSSDGVMDPCAALAKTVDAPCPRSPTSVKQTDTES